MELFDQFGKIKVTFTDAELGALSPERKVLLKSVIDSAAACESLEHELGETQKALHEAVARRAEAMATVQKFRPSPYANWLATFHPELSRHPVTRAGSW